MRFIGLIVAGLLAGFAIVGSAGAVAPDGSSAANAIPLTTGSDSGTIVGSGAGAYRYYVLQGVKADAEVSINFTFSPTEQPVANAIGLVAWQQGARLGQITGQSYTPGATNLRFRTPAAGDVVLQVYSYYPGVAVTFGLQAVATGGAVVYPPAPTETPKSLSPAQPGAPASSTSALLPGNRTGSAHYYQFSYPGGGVVRSITLTVSPNGADVTNAVFLSVYQDGKLLVTGCAREVVVPGVLTLRYSSASSAPVLVEVANYNASRTIAYTLTPGE